MVSGMMPKTLKLTQKSVVWVRQTISLSTASAKKNRAQRRVSLRQPSPGSANTLSGTTRSGGGAGQRQEEQGPAQGQLAPALLGELEHAVEDDLEQGLAEVEPAQQHEPEQGVDDGGLELDEDLVLQE